MRARAARRRGEAQLVVVAAGEQAGERQRRDRAPAQHVASSAAQRGSASRSTAAPTRDARECARGRRSGRRRYRSPRSRRRADAAERRRAAPAAQRALAALRGPRRSSAMRPCSARERERRVAERAGHPDRHRRRSRRCAAAPVPAGTSPRIVTHSVRGPRVVSPPTSSTPMRVGEREEAARECREPALVGVGQRAGEQRPARRRAHRRHVGQIHRERLVAERLGIGAGEEMPALDQHVDRDRDLASGRRAQQTPRRRRRRRRRPRRPRTTSISSKSRARSDAAAKRHAVMDARRLVAAAGARARALARGRPPACRARR